MNEEYMVEVSVILNTKEEDTEEVYFDLNEFFMFEEDEEKIKFIKDMAMEKNHNIEKVNFNKDDLAELESEIEDMNDTSDMHPNETFDEFMEHEDF